MRILVFDELSAALDLDRSLVHLAAFGGTFPRAAVELLRRRTKSFADYVGVFAVERNQVLGQVFVLRIPYAFRDGPDTLSGIAAVGTRPDHGRGGIARTLMMEVHRRERDSGIRYSALWTNRSWGAHGLYEKLGYRDVYSSPWAVHASASRASRRAPPRGVGAGRTSDLEGIDRLHDALAAHRLGYFRRPHGFSLAEVRWGGIDPGSNLLVARRGKDLAGYAQLDRSPRRVICGELVARSESIRRALVAEVGRSARGVPYAFQHTPVTDSPALFRGPNYVAAPLGWYGMMGNALGREWSRREAVAEFATEDPRFICLAADRF